MLICFCLVIHRTRRAGVVLSSDPEPAQTPLHSFFFSSLLPQIPGMRRDPILYPLLYLSLVVLLEIGLYEVK